MRLALGDIHGKDFWKAYLDKSAAQEWTECYILGDYFDSFDIPFQTQYNNFQELCEAARRDTRIKLCLGNHDYHYLSGIFPQQYSGYQEKNHPQINRALETHRDLFKIVYTTEDKYLLSHAGVSKTFMKKLCLTRPEEINDAFLRDRNVLVFDGYECHGDDVTQGPLWIRPDSLRIDALDGWTQIVGHTIGSKIREYAPSSNPAAAQPTSAKIVVIDIDGAGSVFWF